MRGLLAALTLSSALLATATAGFVGVGASARAAPSERFSNCATQAQECTVDGGQPTPYPSEGGGSH
jgi:hypothetical protein